jgi:hypothetical protein
MYLTRGWHQVPFLIRERTPALSVPSARCITMSNRKQNGRARVADEIMAGMRELERMMDEGKTPQQMFTVRTVEVSEPNAYRARSRSAICASRWASARQCSPTCWASRWSGEIPGARGAD